MKLVLGVLSVVSVAALLNGCAPDLAQTPLSVEETQWKEYLKSNYPGWEPPQTIIPENPDVPPKSAAGQSRIVTPQEKVDLSSNIIIEEAEPVNTNNIIITNEPLSEPASEVVDVEPPKESSYTVMKGDTLSGIAKKFYNNANWQAIHKANAELIPDPNKLKPGITLRIPKL
ncbi:MAG: LysM peptidoglycan-binding domain-containing protein [Lentisphaerae bacterium]|nr:LysM peptidoglycan-binding domain-containing protein [Lentisphaerota bacterium]